MPKTEIPDKKIPIDNESDELFQFLGEIQHFTGLSPNVIKDAVKCVQCLRFIAANLPLVEYAVFHPDDERLYTFPGDQEKGVIRDFLGTSMHFNSYLDYPEQCRFSLERSLEQFKAAIIIARKHSKLAEFIQKLNIGNVGCIEARTAAAIQFAQNIENPPPIPLLDELIAPIQKNLTGDELADFQTVCIYLHRNIGKQVRIREIAPDDGAGSAASAALPHTIRFIEHEEILGFRLIRAYMSKMLGYNELVDGTEEKLQSLAYTLTAEEAIEVIKNERGFAKIIQSHSNSFNYNVAQLKDPENERPVKMNLSKVDRTRVYNPRTGKWGNRRIKPQRGEPKPGCRFTKKTAGTLLPQDGRLKLIGGTWWGEESFGLLFDIAKCELKGERYVFRRDAYTNRRWWIAGNSFFTIRAVSLDKLREELRSPKHYEQDFNEVLVGLSYEALKAIVITSIGPRVKLAAIIKQLEIQGTLGLTLPILMLLSEKSVKAYPREAWMADLHAVLNMGTFYDIYLVAKCIHDPVLLKKLKISDLSMAQCTKLTLGLQIDDRHDLAKELFAAGELQDFRILDTLFLLCAFHQCVKNKNFDLATQLLACIGEQIRYEGVLRLMDTKMVKSYSAITKDAYFALLKQEKYAVMEAFLALNIQLLNQITDPAKLYLRNIHYVEQRAVLVSVTKATGQEKHLALQMKINSSLYELEKYIAKTSLQLRMRYGLVYVLIDLAAVNLSFVFRQLFLALTTSSSSRSNSFYVVTFSVIVLSLSMFLVLGLIAAIRAATIKELEKNFSDQGNKYQYNMVYSMVKLNMLYMLAVSLAFSSYFISIPLLSSVAVREILGALPATVTTTASLVVNFFRLVEKRKLANGSLPTSSGPVRVVIDPNAGDAVPAARSSSELLTKFGALATASGGAATAMGKTLLEEHVPLLSYGGGKS